MAGAYTQDNQTGRLTTDLGKDKLLILSLNASERLSESYTVTVDAFSIDPQPIHSLLGTGVGVVFDSAPNAMVTRDFAGVLWEYSELGRDDRGYLYRLVLRPKAEFMTLNRRNRIFQKKSVVDILKSLLVGDFQAKLFGTYEPLEYCVQYQESDFDFVSRLMEFEGIYYYYEHDAGASKMVLVDDRTAHADMVPASVKVSPPADRRPDAPIWSVTERRTLGPTKVTVDDYDFEAPATKLLKFKAAAKAAGTPTDRGAQTQEASGSAWSQSAEVYDFPSKYDTKTLKTGERYGAIWLDAQRRRMARSFADSGLFSATVGSRVTFEFEDGAKSAYLIVGATHDYTAPSYDSGEGEEVFHASLELMPAAEQYRPAQLTPRPRILGPQTAVVVGPPGEEIYTDKHGRIKVQFFWDREGKKDENSSCFIRVVQSGAGKAWGGFALPRIGQEVVIEFLDGDPDRPLVTGAVYNGDNVPPVKLPANMTQTGMRTRITKGGGGYNHWWFEDKKGKEVVWFRAERDYKARIVHANEERQYDGGSRTTLFCAGDDTKTLDKGHLTTLIKKGNEKRTIETGNLDTLIKTGNETHELSTGKRATVINADDTLEIKQGNRSATIKMGNDSLKVSLGNIDTKADLGKITDEAMQSIELIVGQSSIKVDQTGVTIKGLMIKIEGTAMLQTKAPMSQHTGDGMQMIKGGIVMIN